MGNHDKAAKRRKKVKKRHDKNGKLRIPPVALAYFFTSARRLKIVYPVTGEHPDITIKRVVRASGITPSMSSVKVTPYYWDVVRNLPSSTVELVNKNEIKKDEDDGQS